MGNTSKSETRRGNWALVQKDVATGLKSTAQM